MKFLRSYSMLLQRHLPMSPFRQYRPLEYDEFIVAFGDTATGGGDACACAFFSTKYLDFPLVYHSDMSATVMTNLLHPVLERIHDVTGLAPVIAYETNNGGVFELERLSSMNRANKYRIYKMRTYGKVENEEESKIGWNTNTATRPAMLKDYKEAVDKMLVRIFDKPTISQHYSFIINKQGKPEAEAGAHDDLIITHAGCYQLYQTEKPIRHDYRQSYNRQKWSIQ